MTDEKKIELLEELFDLEAGELKAEMSLDSIESWDSMTKLSLIVMMDEECGKTLKSDDIKGFVTVKDIMDYMG